MSDESVLVKCPRCHGTGKIGPYNRGFQVDDGDEDEDEYRTTCPMCRGTCVILAEKAEIR